uniref:Unkown protein n=1 Tax=Riptortus pedestris TaxID=329032 RepID=R4WHT9_RIPPE|nr:unkown protein [Riptortus pedestris]
MKVAILLLFVAAATAYPTLIEEEHLLRNSIDELVKQTLEYVRWLLKRHEPYSFPPLPEQTLVDDDVNLKFSTSNVLLSKASDFTIDKVANNLPKLTSSFGVTVPTAHLEGTYEVTGVAFKKQVQGSGTFSVDIQNLVQTGDIQFTIIDHSLQIQDLKLDYELAGAKFDVEGLNIEGLTKEQVEEFLNNQLIGYLNDHKAFVVEKTANHVKEVANKLLQGHSLNDVLDFLKQIVDTTPDPPPFPTFSPII